MAGLSRWALSIPAQGSRETREETPKAGLSSDGMENLAPISPGADQIERLLEGLNPPQRRAVEHGEGPLLVIAGAGSGKTRVLTRRIAYLVATGQAHPSEILAITFTNKAAQEMRERVEELVGGVSRLMWVMTFHSACARLLRANAERLGYKRSFTIYDQADSLRMVKRCMGENEVDPKRFTPRSIQAAISGAKNRLQDSTDYAEMRGSYFEEVVSEVYSLYERRMVEASAMDFDDLLVRTVNLFELFADIRERYQRTFRWLLVDEYQDTNRAQYRLLQLLAGEQKNLTVVGDDAQCLLAGTQVMLADGGQKPIEQIEIGDAVLSSYGNGDFRGARVAGVYRSHEESGIRLTTKQGKVLTSTREHMHFAGYVLGHTPQQHLTYLMWKRGRGFRVGTTRVYTAGQKKPVIGLRLRTFTEAADAAWVLSTHDSEVEARLAEAVLAAKYELPTLPFVARAGSNAKNSMVASQAHLDKLFASVETEAAGRKLLEDEGLSFQHPHHQAGAFNGTRRVVTLTMCGDRRRDTPMHRISMAVSNQRDKEALEAVGLAVRPAKKNSDSWKYETCFSDFPEAVRVLGKIDGVMDIRVRCVGRFGAGARQYGANALPCIPAASVRPGMAVFGPGGELDTVDQVEHVALDAPVYDIDVADTHNFVANGIVTHNSIYSFRSADVRNILEFEHDFHGAEVVKLEQNYRSTGTILDAANAVIANNTEQKQKNLWTDAGRGEPVVVAELDDEHAEARYVAGEIERLVSEEDYGRDEVAVFYRMNAQSRVLEDTLVRYEVPYQVIGGTKFYERAEVKDAIAYLSLLANPADAISFGRVINSPRRGIGAQTENRILSHANTTGEDVWDVMARPEAVPGLGAAAVKAVHRFAAVMAGLRERAEGDSVAELLESVLHDTGYFDSLEAERTLEAEGRMENLQELIGVAAEFDVNRRVEGEDREDTPLEEFLAQIRLFTEQDGLRDSESLITLMSLHNAKGLEYEAAFIIGCEEGVFPHARSVEEGNLEEERRLAYVGVTRAKRRLYMTCARRRSLHGSSGWNLPSRFLREVPSELTERKAMAVQTGWHGETAGGRRRASAVGFGGAGAITSPSRIEPQGPEVEFRIGDDVVHASFGEGVVTSVEPGSVVVVRFRSEGSERKLMADYAPLKKAS